MSESVFSRKTTIIALVLAGVSLLAGFVGAIFWGDDAQRSRGHNDSYSISALGHRAFIDLLEAAGYHVTRSRFRTVTKLRPDGVLLVLEPDAVASEVEDLVDSAGKSLVVLPKWVGVSHTRKSGWIQDVELIHEGDAGEVLEGLGVSGSVERLTEPDVVLQGFNHPAAVVAPPQVIDSREIRPILMANDKAVFGHVREDATRFVLADPDLIANHGLRRNAAVILEMMARIAKPGSAVIVDETLHGHEVPPNIWAELGEFPLVLVLFSGVILIGAWTWSGMRRFGAPVKVDATPGHGTEALIENTAQLLLFGGHSAAVLQRYFHHVVADAAHFYRLSPELSQAERIERLDALSRASVQLGELHDQVKRAQRREEYDEHHVLALARRVRKWKQETMHGTR